MEVMIPPGYRFVPTDQEIISFYLLRKAMGLPLLCGHNLLEINVYGENANPWDVFKNVSDSHWEDTKEPKKNAVKRVIYIFTRLSKISTLTDKSRNISRTAGCGKWDGQTGKKKICDDMGREIGVTKMLSFKSKNNENDDNWIMHEYSLSGVSLESDIKDKDYVVCRITRTLSKDKYERERKQRIVDGGECSIGSCGDNMTTKKRSIGEVEEDVVCTHHKKQKTAPVVTCSQEIGFGLLTEDEPPLEQLINFNNVVVDWENFMTEVDPIPVDGDDSSPVLVIGDDLSIDSFEWSDSDVVILQQCMQDA